MTHLARILVVDDDTSITTSLKRGLALEGFEVSVAADGRAAIDAIEAAAGSGTPIDGVVLDLNMPKMDGISVCRRLRADGNHVPICILSARDELEDRVEGLRAGADDYLVKPFALVELVVRLQGLLRRTAPNTVPTAVGDLSLDPVRHIAKRGDRTLDLTRREFELLGALMDHPGQVLSRDQLLSLVWGYDFEVESNVVDVFVGYLRRKLEADGEDRVVQTVQGIGFTLRATPRDP